ncbi:MAG: response regulator [Deltaproteobacteria bacterium]|nr:MAG: response regulator [Deltaproteobacteria bacterium]
MTAKKILLVDDVRVFLEVEKSFLKRSGCQIITAKSGKEALEKIRTEVPDLVFLDLMMPDMDGDQVCESVKKDDKTKNIPVIMVSVSGDKKDIERCRKAGCDDYLVKPIEQEQLMVKAARIMEVPQRKDLRVFVRMDIEAEAGDSVFYGESENISMGGMLIKSKVPMKLGSAVIIKFFLPGQKVSDVEYRMEVKGEIVRVDELSFKPECGLGIAFQNLDPAAEKMISDFISKGG